MTMLKFIVLGCVLAAVAVTLKIRIETGRSSPTTCKR